MFKNRVQISRLSGVDGLVCDAGNLELNALVNWKYKWLDQTRKLSYRKDDRAMRPIYGSPEIFQKAKKP